jgi:hypothetical protein
VAQLEEFRSRGGQVHPAVVQDAACAVPIELQPGPQLPFQVRLPGHARRGLQQVDDVHHGLVVEKTAM